jgi:hypothetical protein
MNTSNQTVFYGMHSFEDIDFERGLPTKELLMSCLNQLCKIIINNQ